MTTQEPPKPQRGMTAAERGPDVPAAQAELDAEQLHWRTRAWRSMGPRVYFGQADGYPGPIKWFLWFCLLLIWPAWIVTVLLGVAIGSILVPLGNQLLWVLLTPLRRRQKRNNPEEYAEYMAKHWPNKKP